MRLNWNVHIQLSILSNSPKIPCGLLMMIILIFSLIYLNPNSRTNADILKEGKERENHSDSTNSR